MITSAVHANSSLEMLQQYAGALTAPDLLHFIRVKEHAGSWST